MIVNLKGHKFTLGWLAGYYAGLFVQFALPLAAWLVSAALAASLLGVANLWLAVLCLSLFLFVLLIRDLFWGGDIFVYDDLTRWRGIFATVVVTVNLAALVYLPLFRWRLDKIFPDMAISLTIAIAVSLVIAGVQLLASELCHGFVPFVEKENLCPKCVVAMNHVGHRDNWHHSDTAVGPGQIVRTHSTKYVSRLRCPNCKTEKERRFD